MAETSEEVKSPMDGSPPLNEEPQQGPWKKFSTAVTTYWRLVFTLVLLFLIAFMYQWKTIAVNSAKEELKAEKKRLTEKVGQLVTEKNKTLARLTVIPLSWAVRGEIIRGNHENINLYFKQLVKEDRLKAITLADTEGTILVATDKRIEGSSIANVYPPETARVLETTVTELANGEIMAATPVMGPAGKLGVLILEYLPAEVDLGQSGS